MTTDPNNTSDDHNPGIEEIEADIARSREELAETVDELTARMDVKARAKDRVRQTRDQVVARVRTVRAQATDARGRPTPTTLGAGGAVVAAVAVVVALALWRRRRR